MNYLDRILAHKREEIVPLLHRTEILRAAALERNAFASLKEALTRDPGGLSVIAEVKKASPSAGVIAPDFDPEKIAQAYVEGGADAISVLTDENFFQGSLAYLSKVKAAHPVIPVLRKDFIVHEAQIYEAAVAGADAILLIVAALEQPELERFLDVARSVQLEVLVEVHDQLELERALELDIEILGVNNRNLKTFAVDIETTHQLGEQVPESVVLVSESGLSGRAEAERLHRWGVDAVLVGEALMRSGDPAAIIEQFHSPVESE